MAFVAQMIGYEMLVMISLCERYEFGNAKCYTPMWRKYTARTWCYAPMLPLR